MPVKMPEHESFGMASPSGTATSRGYPPVTLASSAAGRSLCLRERGRAEGSGGGLGEAFRASGEGAHRMHCSCFSGTAEDWM